MEISKEEMETILAIKTEKRQKVEKILTNLGIEMQVGGCGCCGSPWVTFRYKGKTILDDEDDCEIDTMKDRHTERDTRYAY